jgi:excisionase family DNA binding protein
MTATLTEPSDRWLTVHEAAQARGLTYRRTIQMIRDGYLPSSKIGGERGQHLIKLADLDALLAAGYRPAKRGPLAVQR